MSHSDDDEYERSLTADNSGPVIRIESVRDSATSTNGRFMLGLNCTCFSACMTAAVIALACLGVMIHMDQQGERHLRHATEQAAARDPHVAWAAGHAALLSSWSDPTADPCTDFYQFSCGGYLSANQEPSGSFDSLQRHIDDELLAVLREQWPIVGTWFRACEDTASRAQRGLSALQPLLDQIDSAATPLPVLLARLHQSGVPALFSVWFGVDERNTSRPAGYAGYAPVATPNTSTVDAVRELAVQLTGTDLGAVFAQRWLATQMIDPATLYTADTQWAPSAPVCAAFDWSLYWASLLGAGPSPPVQVGTRDPSYLSDAVCAAAGAPGVRDYLRLAVMLEFVDAFPNSSALLAALHDGGGGGSPQSLDTECRRSTEAAFPDLLGHYFSVEYFSPDIIDMAERLMAAVRASMQATLAATEWLDNVTRSAALAKLAALRTFVGRPSRWPSSTMMSGDLVSPYDHLANVLQHRRSVVQYNLALWTSEAYFQSVRAAPPGWGMPVFEVNAEYDPTENMILLPEGILGGVFFNESAPRAVNFGGIGTVMGHELTHGYDNQGSQYDGQGNLRNWWTPVSRAAFDERAECIREWYDARGVNGALTLGENIADSGGVAVALRALRSLPPPSDTEREIVRHFYKMSETQLFFRTYASLWCGKRSPQRAAELLRSDPHSPLRYRVQGVVSQSAEFAEAFNCPVNRTACKVW